MAGDANPWSSHQRRAEQLRGRFPFAAELLGLYRGLLDVWREAWTLAADDRPTPGDLSDWSVRQVLPRVVKATEAAGPAALAAAVREASPGQAMDACTDWLSGVELPPVETYLARTCLRPGLTAFDEHAVAEAFAADQALASAGDLRCPRCGGLPQLSVRAAGDDPLVRGGRNLVCSRCSHTWSFSVSTCPSCGETTGAKRTLYAEQYDGPIVGRPAPGPDGGPTHPHIRIEACATCGRYLLDIDLGGDPAAVPEVDELAAVPLALYAGDQGLTKITPNLLGF
jgi:FdhE protein